MIHSGFRHGYVLPKGKFYAVFDAKVQALVFLHVAGVVIFEIMGKNTEIKKLISEKEGHYPRPSRKNFRNMTCSES
jgi:hypothetical protein